MRLLAGAYQVISKHLSDSRLRQSGVSPADSRRCLCESCLQRMGSRLLVAERKADPRDRPEGRAHSLRRAIPSGLPQGSNFASTRQRTSRRPQMVSVDSDCTGVNQPGDGHERSQSTTPRFGGGATRVSRYSPALTSSTSNCSPGTMPSASRSSAGRQSDAPSRLHLPWCVPSASWLRIMIRGPARIGGRNDSAIVTVRFALLAGRPLCGLGGPPQRPAKDRPQGWGAGSAVDFLTVVDGAFVLA